jgi:GntR family transcriptional regulator
MLSQIVSGTWQAGDQLPTEKQLCDMLDVSRSTVRSAVQSLVRDGFVIRTPGKGSFIAARPTTQIKVPPLGFHRAMTARGYRVRSELLEMSVVEASRDLIQDLCLHKVDKVLYVYRLRYVNDLPAALTKNYLAYKLCRGIEDQDLSEGSLWARLERRLGRKVAGGIHMFYAVAAFEEERRLLRLGPHLPLLMSVGTNYLDNGAPFERAEVKIPGDSGFLVARHFARSESSVEGGLTGLANAGER